MRREETGMPKPGTPYFVVHENELRNNVDAFKNALMKYWPNSRVAYSVKTNALPWLLKWLRSHDINAEAVSEEEYLLARKCGFSGEEIIFNGPIKGKERFKEAITEGATVNVDSDREISWLSEVHPEPNKLGVRINADPDIFDLDDIGFHEDGFRFGFADNGTLQRVFETLDQIYPDRTFGLHLHVNSITRSVAVYRELSAFAASIIKKYNLTPSFIDIGGGFFGGVPGKATPEDYIRTIFEELKDTVNIRNTQLIVEPGSAIAGSAFDLYTTVLDVKDTLKARIVTTDGSRVHIDPLWQKTGYMHTTTAVKAPVSRQVICGYTCMDHDRLMVLENEPELSEGDTIIYHRVGNYTVTFGGPFIRMFPEVYAERSGELVKIRSGMDIEDYYRIESAE